MFSVTHDNYYIYTLKDPKTEQIRYVGVTYRLKRRYQDHIQTSKKMKTHKDKWIQCLLKEGLKPKMIIIEKCNKEVLEERERYWIAYYKDKGANLTNASMGGEGLFNPTEETIEKIRAAQIGKKRAPLTEDHKKKLSVSHIGIKFTEERKQNISKAKKGKPQSEEHKRKLSEAKIGKKRKPFTLETLEKMRSAQQRGAEKQRERWRLKKLESAS